MPGEAAVELKKSLFVRNDLNIELQLDEEVEQIEPSFKAAIFSQEEKAPIGPVNLPDEGCARSLLEEPDK